MTDEILLQLKVHEYFRGVGDEALREIAGIARVSRYETGAVVHEAGAADGRLLRGDGVVIAPDVTGFELSEFMKAEIAAVGERTALAQIPDTKKLLNRLDPRLFNFGP